MAVITLLSGAIAAYGQNAGGKTAKAASADKDEEDFSPQDITLQAKDDAGNDEMKLAATYYPGKEGQGFPGGSAAARLQGKPKGLRRTRPATPRQARLRGPRARSAGTRREQERAERREDASEAVRRDGHAGHGGGDGFPPPENNGDEGGQAAAGKLEQTLSRGGGHGGDCRPGIRPPRLERDSPIPSARGRRAASPRPWSFSLPSGPRMASRSHALWPTAMSTVGSPSC